MQSYIESLESLLVSNLSADIFLVALFIFVLFLSFVFYNKIFKEFKKGEITRKTYFVIVNIVRLVMIIIIINRGFYMDAYIKDLDDLKNEKYNIVVGEVVGYRDGYEGNSGSVHTDPSFKVYGYEELIDIDVPNTELGAKYEIIYGKHSRLGVIIREINQEEET